MGMIKILKSPNYVEGRGLKLMGTGPGMKISSVMNTPLPPVRYNEIWNSSPVLWGSQWLADGITSNIGGGTMITWDMSSTPPTGYKHPNDYQIISDLISGSGQNLYAIARTLDTSSWNGLGNTHVLVRFDKLTHAYSGTVIDTFPVSVPYETDASFGGVYSLDCLKTSSNEDIWFVSDTAGAEHLWKFDSATHELSGTNINVDGILNGAGARLSSFLIDQSDVIWCGGYTTTDSPTQPFFLRIVPTTGEVSSTMLPFPNTYGRVQSLVDDPSSGKIWATGYVDAIDGGPAYAFWNIDKSTHEVSGTFHTLYSDLSDRITDLWTPDSNDGWYGYDNQGSAQNVAYVSTAVLHGGKVWNAFRGERSGDNYGEIDLINIDTSTGVISQKFVDTSAWGARGPMGNLLLSGSNDLYLCSLAGGKGGSVTTLYRFDTSADTTTTSTVSDLYIYLLGRKSIDPVTGKISMSANVPADIAVGPEETGVVPAVVYYDPVTDAFEVRKFALFTDGSSQEY